MRWPHCDPEVYLGAFNIDEHNLVRAVIRLMEGWQQLAAADRQSDTADARRIAQAANLAVAAGACSLALEVLRQGPSAPATACVAGAILASDQSRSVAAAAAKMPEAAVIARRLHTVAAGLRGDAAAHQALLSGHVAESEALQRTQQPEDRAALLVQYLLERGPAPSDTLASLCLGVAVSAALALTVQQSQNSETGLRLKSFALWAVLDDVGLSRTAGHQFVGDQLPAVIEGLDRRPTPARTDGE